MTTLFDPLELRDGIRLNNRIIMAPMTRSRATPNGVPSPLAAEYYAQRATAGLIITEGVVVSPQGKGYSLTPGLHTDEQAAAWTEVTSAVHSRVGGARIFAQLWHVGRVSHEDIAGLQPVGPSPLRPPRAKVWLEREDGWQGNIDCSTPREMTAADIRETIKDFRRSAHLAIEAGFDGVEIHAANGYLIDQFLRTTTNRRTDSYGGSIEGRLRLMQEVVEAVAEEVGANRVGVRFSPYVDLGDTMDPQIEDTLVAAAEWLDSQRVSYLHVVEAENQDLLADSFRGASERVVHQDFQQRLRRAFKGAIILAYRYDLERATQVLSSGRADAVAFGRPYIANPDLVTRLQHGLSLADSDTTTWYGGGPEGYTDYAPLHLT